MVMTLRSRAEPLAAQPISVLTGSDDREGRLVLVNGDLVAVLVRLDGPVHENQRGGWFLEAGFGPCSGPPQPVFDSLAEAQVWVSMRVARASA
jgi:hypothetical protein